MKNDVGKLSSLEYEMELCSTERDMVLLNIGAVGWHFGTRTISWENASADQLVIVLWPNRIPTHRVP